MCYCMHCAGGNLLCSGEAEYISPIMFRTYGAGQTHVFPVPVFVPSVPINRDITYNRTLIWISQYLISNNMHS